MVSRASRLSLAAIAVLSLIPSLLLSSAHHVEYDGFWHVWISVQNSLSTFLYEYRNNAHPPLYFVLLHFTLLFGRTQFVYRLVSLLSAAASVYVFGLTAFRAMRSPRWAILATAAFALSSPLILMAIEVRTYTLAALLVQISFLFLVRLAEEPASIRLRLAFAATATLACLTEYYAFFYVGAIAAITLLPSFLYRRAKPFFTDLATLFAILALPAWEYVSHFTEGVSTYAHLPGYYYDLKSGELPGDFVWRNLRNELNWFLPWPIPDSALYYVAVVLIALAVASILFVCRRDREPQDRSSRLLLILPLVMLAGIALAAMLRLYPFGGYLRQQYVLFPFLAAWPFLVGDRLPGSLRAIPLGVTAVAVAAAFYFTYPSLPRIGRPLFSDEMARFDSLNPRPEAILVDGFNQPILFIHRHDWSVEFLNLLPKPSDHDIDTVDVFRFSKNGQSFLMLRDRNVWSFDLTRPEVYWSASQAIGTQHVSAVSVLALAQSQDARNSSDASALRTKASELASANGLCLALIDFVKMDVYARVQPAGTCQTAPGVE